MRMQEKRFMRSPIICLDTFFKSQEFIYKRDKEGINVLDSLWARNDANADNVLEMEPNARRQIVVEDDEGPRRMLPFLEWCKTVARESQCNVTFSREEFDSRSCWIRNMVRCL